MSHDDERAALVMAVVNLRHLYAQPTIDRSVATGIIAPEIRRLEEVITGLDAHHDQIARLVADATAARAALDAQLARAERALRQVMQVLGPKAPEGHEGCPGCNTEIALALDAVQAYGIAYRPRKPEGQP